MTYWLASHGNGNRRSFTTARATSNTAASNTAVRRAANELPNDERHSALVEIRHRADQFVKTAARAGVIIPVLIGVGGGLLAVNLGADSPVITDGLIVGGVLSGLFNYGQAIADAMRERRQLQIQLAAGIDLEKADLARIDLSRAYLRGKKLDGVRLSGATCYEADFSIATLRDARLTQGTFTRANFESADLTAAGCFEAKLTRCSFERASLLGASMCGADLRGSNLTNANLGHSDLRRARLEDCILDAANMEGAWYSPSTTWPAGFEPPSDPEQDPHGRILREDSREEEVPLLLDIRTESTSST